MTNSAHQANQYVGVIRKSHSGLGANDYFIIVSIEYNVCEILLPLLKTLLRTSTYKYSIIIER
jgi:hypothetical protein